MIRLYYGFESVVFLAGIISPGSPCLLACGCLLECEWPYEEEQSTNSYVLNNYAPLRCQVTVAIEGSSLCFQNAFAPGKMLAGSHI
jgi:hypothetical protein